jgi:glycine/D-amino acid oxidase-like deaminating enzyme
MTTSHWHATFTPTPLPLVDLPRHASMVVLGNGVLGATTALWLARAGHAPLVVDRGGPAAGASGRNGGLLVPGTTNGYLETITQLGAAAARDLWAFTAHGVALMKQVIAEEQIACDLAEVGNLNVLIRDEQFQHAAATVERLRADGFAAELLDRVATQEVAGMPLGAEVVGAKLNPLAATLHSAKLVYGLTAAALRHGARRAEATVQQISATADGVTIVTDQGALTAERVIVTANAWSGDVLPELADLITPVRGQVLTAFPEGPRLRTGFGASVTATGEYGQHCADGSFLIGGCRAIADGRDVAVRSLDTSEPVQHALEDCLRRLFPTLATGPIRRRWAGTMGFTPDYLPIIDAAQEVPGVWYAGGFSGHGMPFAAIVAQCLAEAATTGQLPAATAVLGRGRFE